VWVSWKAWRHCSMVHLPFAVKVKTKLRKGVALILIRLRSLVWKQRNGKGYLAVVVVGAFVRTLAETVAQQRNGCTESSCSVRLPSGRTTGAFTWPSLYNICYKCQPNLSLQEQLLLFVLDVFGMGWVIIRPSQGAAAEMLPKMTHDQGRINHWAN